MSILSLDIQTSSPLNLNEVGAWAYAESEETHLECLAWRLGDSAVTNCILPGSTDKEHQEHFERDLRQASSVSGFCIEFEIAMLCGHHANLLGLPEIPKILDVFCLKARANAGGVFGPLHEVASLPIPRWNQGMTPDDHMIRSFAIVKAESELLRRFASFKYQRFFDIYVAVNRKGIPLADIALDFGPFVSKSSKDGVLRGQMDFLGGFPIDSSVSEFLGDGVVIVEIPEKVKLREIYGFLSESKIQANYFDKRFVICNKKDSGEFVSFFKEG
jgi:hypothetical protein